MNAQPAVPAPGPAPQVEAGRAGARVTVWKGMPRGPRMLALVFLLPALLLLGALVVYPIAYTVIRSLFDATGEEFVGLGNYTDMFRGGNTLTAIKNNAIWVLVAPAVVTALGLIFAVLTERIKWATAFKALVFMPMAISFLASGIIFRLVYEQDPDRGAANAALVTVHDVFARSSAYPGARPLNDQTLTAAPGGGFQSVQTFRPGQVAALGLVGISSQALPANAVDAAAAEPAPGTLVGTVWFDFSPGGGGQPDAIEAGEKGLPGITVEALRDGAVAATASTGDRGQFAFTGLTDGDYTLRLPESNFREPFNGLSWLGPSLVTPAIIGAYVWIWAGFAMVLIAAGLAAIPREALEAARVDGATEWQVFRRVTVPLLAPVLVVVLVTLVINVLKVFDLVFIIAPGSSQDDATVLALEMWRVSFGGGNNQGLGSALAVFLFLLVLPAMIFNIRRFRREK